MKKAARKAAFFIDCIFTEGITIGHSLFCLWVSYHLLNF
jgi:hypothetical protein